MMRSFFVFKLKIYVKITFFLSIHFFVVITVRSHPVIRLHFFFEKSTFFFLKNAENNPNQRILMASLLHELSNRCLIGLAVLENVFGNLPPSAEDLGAFRKRPWFLHLFDT